MKRESSKGKNRETEPVLASVRCGGIKGEHLVGYLLIDGRSVGCGGLRAKGGECGLNVDPMHEIRLLIDPERGWRSLGLTFVGLGTEITFDAEAIHLLVFG